MTLYIGIFMLFILKPYVSIKNIFFVRFILKDKFNVALNLFGTYSVYKLSYKQNYLQNI